MCNEVLEEKISKDNKRKLDKIKSKVKECEIMSVKIKAMQFTNFQSFDYVHENYEQGEVYVITDVGYTVITKKNDFEIHFVVIMGVNNIWKDHFQDVDKHLKVKQGVYLDLYTGKEYKDKIHVPKFTPSLFQAVGDEDLVLQGRVFKQ